MLDCSLGASAHFPWFDIPNRYHEPELCLIFCQRTIPFGFGLVQKTT